MNAYLTYVPDVETIADAVLIMAESSFQARKQRVKELRLYVVDVVAVRQRDDVPMGWRIAETDTPH